MFRPVCMKHRSALKGELALRKSETSRNAWEWDLDPDMLYCPKLDHEIEQIGIDVFGPTPASFNVWNDNDKLAPATTEQSERHAALVAEAQCHERWYVVDEAGHPAYMTPKNEDKEVFSRVDPLAFWEANLEITK